MEIVSIVFGVVIVLLGLYFLLTPYEKLTAKLMKPKSKRNIRVRGWLILICGVLLIALQIVLLVLGQQ